jgi:uncharacterized alkaline shock family protein YloU
MKIWNRIVSTIYILAGSLFAFFFLAIWAKQNFLFNATAYIEKEKISFGLTGTGIILVGIVWIINWLDHLYKTKVITFDNPDGKIKISLKAIENYINTMLTKQVKDIHSLKVKTSISSKGLNTKISLRIFSHFNIPELCTHIQEVTKNYLQDAIGIERIGNIEIFISRIKSGDAQDNEQDAVGLEPIPDTEEVE